MKPRPVALDRVRHHEPTFPQRLAVAVLAQALADIQTRVLSRRWLASLECQTWCALAGIPPASVNRRRFGSLIETLALLLPGDWTPDRLEVIRISDPLESVEFELVYLDDLDDVLDDDGVTEVLTRGPRPARGQPAAPGARSCPPPPELAAPGLSAPDRRAGSDADSLAAARTSVHSPHREGPQKAHVRHMTTLSVAS